ncbi:MAG: enoyl-CoA hydratase-related protein [Aeromicrobium sp.]
MSSSSAPEGAPTSTAVEVRRDGPIGWITLDGPDRLNAIGTRTYTAVAAAVRGFEQDGTTRAVVVHGRGRGFSAGADIEEIGGFAGRSAFEQFIHGFTDALDVLEASPLPIIAAIHGAALGGGLELAMACDLRVATPTAQLGLPEARLGVLPGAGGTQRLPRLVPAGIAREMLMIGSSVTGTRAHAVGLVNQLAEPDALLATAGTIATTLAAGSRHVAAAAKALLATTSDLTLADGIVQERRIAADLFAAADGREGFASFIARRPPAFEGAPPRES